jgi:hypothetical protein
MTEYDDLPFAEPDDMQSVVVLEREPRKCRHPRNQRSRTETGWVCVCGHSADRTAIRRGTNARKRGLSIQLEHARRLGLTNLNGNGAADAKSETVYGNAAFVAQMKSGGLFPGWMQRELDYLPRTGGRVPLLVVVETPGPGRKARALVVMDESDWIDLHRGTNDV